MLEGRSVRGVKERKEMEYEVTTDILGQVELHIFLTCDQWYRLEKSPEWHRLMECAADLQKEQARFERNAGQA